MIDELIKKAIEMRNKAIAPYSKYTVGSAILTESGKTFGDVMSSLAAMV